MLRVILRLPSNQQLDYHPGQYIDVIGKDGMRRSYSIANAPAVEKLIELHIRQVATGAMSRYWFEEAKVNELLRFSRPLGTFFIRDVSGLNLILLATGTGMAPIKATLEGMAAGPKEDLPSSISVCWGGRVPQDPAKKLLTTLSLNSVLYFSMKPFEVCPTSGGQFSTRRFSFTASRLQRMQLWGVSLETLLFAMIACL